ncbi:hypothetical protein [Campylobacter canadensis]|nr:hypothetical protein [Campylobacter canadensis]
MQDFLNTAKLMCETLGYFVFSKPKDIATIINDDILYLKTLCVKG